MNLVLTSERLLLRPFAETDVDVEVEIGTDPEIMKYVGAVETKDQIIRNMAKYTRRCADGCIGVWCVIERATNEKLGTAILLPLPIDEADTNWHLVAGESLYPKAISRSAICCANRHGARATPRRCAGGC